MFTEGAVFGRRDLGAPVVFEGEAFDLTARREGDTLTIEIDGKLITTGKLASTDAVDVGLRPHRSTLRVADQCLALWHCKGHRVKGKLVFVERERLGREAGKPGGASSFPQRPEFCPGVHETHRCRDSRPPSPR